MKYNKYRNKWTKCNLNHKHQSIIEAKYCNYLQILKKGKQIKDFDIQISFKFIVNNIKICDYRVDFKIINNDATIEYHEVKGIETEKFKLQKKLFYALYPREKLIIIKKLPR